MVPRGMPRGTHWGTLGGHTAFMAHWGDTLRSRGEYNLRVASNLSKATQSQELRSHAGRIWHAILEKTVESL